MKHACINDWFNIFIRSEFVQNTTASRDSDFINFPDRASHCVDAAEYGADGKTHSDIIKDWRGCLHDYIDAQLNRNKNRRPWAEFPYRFELAVESVIDSHELWHLNNESLFTEIG